MAMTVAVALLTLTSAPSAFAAPTLQVSATQGLSKGQTITVGGSGFSPDLSGIAVGQCSVDYTGPSDCNLSGGATFRNADAKGDILEVTIKLAVTFGDVDCSKEQCIIAAAPLPTTSSPEEVAANTVEIPIYFGEAEPPGAAAGSPAPVAAASVVDIAPGAQTVSSVLTSPDKNDNVLYVLIATNLALLGGGLYLGLVRPARTRRSGLTR